MPKDISHLFFHRANIYRVDEVDTDTMGVEETDVLIASNVKCRISKKKGESEVGEVELEPLYDYTMDTHYASIVKGYKVTEGGRTFRVVTVYKAPGLKKTHHYVIDLKEID